MLRTKKDFNTSHVNVNQRAAIEFERVGIYFNTSHVNVNLNDLVK